ncbi:hypothetical protein [Mycetocola sp. 2940]|uniref:hypothetical protein n=1 Tax=Mycetocola sp. 2940 TaxID=3156452 RepID=UPI00339450E5
MSSTVLLERAGRSLTVTTPAYRLEVRETEPASAPYAVLSDSAGREWTEFSLLSSVHTVASADEVFRLGNVTARRAGDAVDITAVLSSSAWTQHETRVRCTADRVELSIVVTGSGRITEVTVFGGVGAMPNGATGTFRSSIGFAGILVPAPTEPIQLVRPARSSAQLGVVGDADPGRLHAVFSPPPLAFGLSRREATDATDVPDGEWLGLWLRAPVAALGFAALRYDPLDSGFLLRLDYEGHTVVDGSWTSPVFVLRPAASGWSVLEDYREDLVTAGDASADGPAVAAWWNEPIFCGWGAQCARAAHRLLGGTADLTVDVPGETDSEESLIARGATGYARADVYDEFLARLDAHDLVPGTIVIDDRWQAHYGTGTVDEERWPDLAGWISDRHAAGQRVLLWWKAWDPQGIPPEECIRDAGGRAVSVDPTNPSYRERLTAIVRTLLSPGGVDADGFKVDFTQRVPSGRTLSAFGTEWGIAALHLLLATLHSAVRAAKPDALVITHAMHPSFADVSGMVRLNDVSKRDLRGERVPVVDQLAFRHAIASRALPHHPIDTDQWPMPNRAEWLRYADAQIGKGVPALYYLESIDRSGEHIDSADLARIAATWRRYREAIAARSTAP